MMTTYQTAPSNFPIAITSGESAQTALSQALIESGFWLALESKRFLSHKAKSDFTIIIKPDFNALELKGSTATDPNLVEHLIDLLHQNGYEQIRVAESLNQYDSWLENRDVQILADLLGYGYVTPGDVDYDVIDLGEQLSTPDFSPGSVLHHIPLPQCWLSADFRVIFGKNKTDSENAFYLCLNNLVSLLPWRNKSTQWLEYLDLTKVFSELLTHSQIDFCLLDAWISNHGNGGGDVAHPIETKTIIAGQNLLATDWVAVKKMGLDFTASPIHCPFHPMLEEGSCVQVQGDDSPYLGWINVCGAYAEAVRRRRKCKQLSRVIDPWLVSVDTTVFTFKDTLNAQLNRVMSRHMSQLDTDQKSLWFATAVNQVLAQLSQMSGAVQIMLFKDSLNQQYAPLNIDPKHFSEQDFQQIESYLNEFRPLVKNLTYDHTGLRWVFDKDGSVIFEVDGLIPVNYDSFVAKVDISKSIQYMNDYIGGTILPYAVDQKNRVRFQLERNVYLPQPNYLALFGGKPIDVSKIETLDYQAGQQTMFWKTIISENGSALYDDGSVQFIRSPENETQVKVFGRQHFTLPPFWQWVNLDFYPIMKERLYTWSYQTFFTNTIANFEAVYQGRETKIGHSWALVADESQLWESDQVLSVRIGEIISRIHSLIQAYLPENGQSVLSSFFVPFLPPPDCVDGNGFSHFSSDSVLSTKPQDNLPNVLHTTQATATDFWHSLLDAMKKDAGVH